MRVKISALSGTALDWVVAKCEGQALLDPHDNEWEYCWNLLGDNSGNYYFPSVDWAQGGPLIQREKMTLFYDEDGQTYSAYVSLFRQRGMSNRTRWRSGPTPLIAAMRAFCCSLLGEEVEIPDELLP